MLIKQVRPNWRSLARRRQGPNRRGHVASGSQRGYQAQGLTQREQLIWGWVGYPCGETRFWPQRTWVHIVFLLLTRGVALDQ